MSMCTGLTVNASYIIHACTKPYTIVDLVNCSLLATCKSILCLYMMMWQNLQHAIYLVITINSRCSYSYNIKPTHLTTNIAGSYTNLAIFLLSKL